MRTMTTLLLVAILITALAIVPFDYMHTGHNHQKNGDIIIINIATDNETNNVTANVSNVTFYPLMEMVLNDNSTLNFTSIDGALYNIYNGSVDIREVKQINMTTIDQYIDYLNATIRNESLELNLTFIHHASFSFLGF